MTGHFVTLRFHYTCRVCQQSTGPLCSQERVQPPWVHLAVCWTQNPLGPCLVALVGASGGSTTSCGGSQLGKSLVLEGPGDRQAAVLREHFPLRQALCPSWPRRRVGQRTSSPCLLVITQSSPWGKESRCWLEAWVGQTPSSTFLSGKGNPLTPPLACARWERCRDT